MPENPEISQRPASTLPFRNEPTHVQGERRQASESPTRPQPRAVSRHWIQVREGSAVGAEPTNTGQSAKLELSGNVLGCHGTRVRWAWWGPWPGWTQWQMRTSPSSISEYRYTQLCPCVSDSLVSPCLPSSVSVCVCFSFSPHLPVAISEYESPYLSPVSVSLCLCLSHPSLCSTLLHNHDHLQTWGCSLY